jgi:hypothetical protein
MFIATILLQSVLVVLPLPATGHHIVEPYQNAGGIHFLRTAYDLPPHTLNHPIQSPETPLFQFDALYKGDAGHLLVSAVDIRWQDYVHPNRSQSWPYNVIRKFQRNQSDRVVKLQSDARQKFQFQLMNDQGLTDDAYHMIQNQIAEAQRAS